ncbi:chromosome partition protein Smc [Kordia sp. SMS9]|uniref:PASTA domain-containing protein n=1 Tax=Kordia sp. SMS9 TaxID=2282170 RepID=UPI000E0CBF46|nr:PASTA domain-containing protein [Kordia sp. SMS9]AXG70880.1 chromosome partition protein Smc [Kordia sp. SMS9]
MAVNIQSIQFQHILFDVNDKPVKTAKVQIQFYNVYLKSWLAFTDDLIVSSGKLVHALKIPSRISTTNQTIRVVREVLKSGGTPSFRIISATSQSGLPEVIATTFTATIEGDSKLNIDFGKSWLLDPKAYIKKIDHLIIATQVPVFELSNTIRIMEEEKDNAVAQVTGLNTTITSLADERDSLLSQLSIVQNDFETRNQQVADLNNSLQTISANLANEQALRETLEVDKNNLEAELAAQREQMEGLEMAEVGGANYQNMYDDLQEEVSNISIERDDLQLQISDITIERDDLIQQVSDISIERDNLQIQVSDISIERDNLQIQVSNLTTEKDNLALEKVSFLASISQLQTAVQQEKARVTAKETELQNQQTLVNNLQVENGKLQEQLAEAQDFSITDHPNKLSASKVYSSIVNDVVKAEEELVNSRYKLSNISLNLKTTVEKGPEGTIFGLLDYESAKDVNSAAISDISLDIVPSDTLATNVSQKMPNILGLTETAVRKVLLNYGLQLDAVYHATEDKNLIAGQAFKQSPAPDTAVEEGQEVIVIFAKPLN